MSQFTSFAEYILKKGQPLTVGEIYAAWVNQGNATIPATPVTGTDLSAFTTDLGTDTNLQVSGGLWSLK